MGNKLVTRVRNVFGKRKFDVRGGGSGTAAITEAISHVSTPMEAVPASPMPITASTSISSTIVDDASTRKADSMPTPLPAMVDSLGNFSRVGSRTMKNEDAIKPVRTDCLTVICSYLSSFIALTFRKVFIRGTKFNGILFCNAHIYLN